MNASDECYQSKTFIDGNLTKDYINYLISIDVKTPKQKGKEAQKLKEDLSSDFQEKFKEKIEDFGLCYMQDRSTDFSDYAKQIKKFLKYEDPESSLYRKLRKNKKDTPDIIFQVTIYNSLKIQKDYIEINIKNADPRKIKTSGKLATYRTEGLNINPDDFKDNAVDKFITEFFSRYFLTSIEITDIDLSEDFTVIRNDKELKDNNSEYIKNENTNSITVYNIPKHINSYLQIESDDKISKKYYLRSKAFLLSESNRALNINKMDLSCDCVDNSKKDSQYCYLVCQNREFFSPQIRDKFPIVKLKLSDHKKSDDLSDLKPVINITSFNNREKIEGIYSNGLYEFYSKKEGKHISLMKNEGYANPFPFLIEFKDSSSYTHKTIQFDKKINLYKKSKPMAHTMNILCPGSGLFYSKDKSWMSSVHLISYLSILGLTNNSYNKFLDYRDDYNNSLIEYDNDPTLFNRNTVESNHRLAKNSKNEFRTYIGLALVVNILSNYYLDQFFKGRINW